MGHGWACFWVVAQLGLFVRSVRVFFASYNGASQGRPDRRAYHRGEGPAREADRSMERETDKNDLLQRQTFLFMCLYTTPSQGPHTMTTEKGSVVHLDRPPPF